MNLPLDIVNQIMKAAKKITSNIFLTFIENQ